ncbi:MAG: hypothetical protein B7X40_04950 [Cellulomonas sp. 14-74-6]|jgi:flagellar protein FliO/FliZ|nr:MAG: hypothetical protein B7X40_04950 [Cellulomonas sp. 14-74-6]
MGETLLVLLRVAVSLGVVIALILYVGRRLSAGRAAERTREADVHVVGRQGLGRHSGVAVIAAGDRRLLVGFSDTSVQLLTELGPVASAPVGAAGDRAGTRAAKQAAVTTSTPAGGADAVPVVGSPLGLPGAGPALGSVPHPRPALDGTAHQSALAGALAGSVLSPQTWRAAVRALQDRTVRR